MGRRVRVGWVLGFLAFSVEALALPPAGPLAPPRFHAPSPPGGRGDSDEELVPGSLLVRYRDGATMTLPGGAQTVRGLGERTLLLRAGDGDGAALAARLRANPEVLWAEPEHVRRPCVLPPDAGNPTDGGAMTTDDDPLSTDASGVRPDDPLYGAQWSLPLARVPRAWARSRGSERVVVAVLDTGKLDHPDLAGRWLPGYDFISSSDSAGDGNGRDPDPTDPGSISGDSSGLHGTHVAGIVGAHDNNGMGIAGVDWNCKLLPVRVLGVKGGRGSDSDIADGIRWAAGLHVKGVPDNPTPADVINLSLGGRGGSSALQDAIDDAYDHGVIVVAAAGNQADDASKYAPAGLRHVITVGATNRDGLQASYSNRGPRVDLMAPGGDLSDGSGGGILSTLGADNEYGWLSGTSQAAPHVSGAVALLRGIDPTINADDALRILQASADPAGQCDSGCGAGLLDADAALAEAEAGCDDGHCQPDARPRMFAGSGCSFDGSARWGGSMWVLGLAFVLLTLPRLRRTLT